ncbi:MAG: hypothetical protein JXA14_22445 [Anaerolineae bacterium]|nr:hypothetical protein [Anaerolineae bacterium]
MNAPKISRRQFIKIAVALSAVAVPSLMGYGLVHEAKGELPPNGSPYAPVDVMESWPSRPEAASPILLLIHQQADNPFGAYLAEILRAEGINCFQTAYVSDLGRGPLDGYDQILLAEGPLSDRQVELLEGYVSRGGRLVAMRPGARLASLLGVKWVGGSTAEGYLKVEASHSIGQGIAAQSLQFHGTADHFSLAGAEAVAWLASDADSVLDFPAVTVHRSGEGLAALWAFDLARSVAYTRQGNPAWADQERDGLDGIRAIDMYKGWVDLDRLLIPQADEQQRLLANLLSALTQDLRPLPRLWYFPGAAPTMLIATGDSHQNPAYAIEDVLTRVEQRGGHMSVYYAPPVVSDCHRAARKAKRWAEDLPLIGGAIAGDSTPPSPSDIANWRARGHEFAIHPYVEEGLEAGWRRYWKEFTGLGYGPVPPTVRTHRILWTGWVETARMQAALGMRLNLDTYHVGPALRRESGEWIYGHFTGSGLPMRFVDEQGRIVNIYQQLTQLVDEHLLARLVPSDDWPQLDAEGAIEVSRTILDHSLAGAYSAIVAQFHPDRYIAGWELGPASARWLEGTLDYAAAKGVPIWSALEWLRFTEVRHDVGLADVQWHSAGKRLGFQVAAEAAPEVELAIMVPLRHGDATLVQVEIDGVVEKHGERAVGGVSYAWVPVQAGPHQVVAKYA